MPTDENRRIDRETLRTSARYTEFNNTLSTMNTYLAAADNATRLMVLPAGQMTARR